MPVMKEQRRIGAVQPGGIVQASGAQAWAQVAANAASTAITVGEKFGRVMTDLQVSEAISLAENAKIEVDENGVPQVDRSVANRFGRTARAAYDKALDDRFRQRLTTALSARFDELAVEYDGDPAGFNLAASAAVEGMGDNVPSNFQGYWSDESARLGAGHGARIGKVQLARAQARSEEDFADAREQAPGRLESMAFAGNMEAAEAHLATLRRLGEARVSQGLMGQAEVEDALQEARAGLAIGMIKVAARDDPTGPWDSDRFDLEKARIRAGTSRWKHMFTDSASRAIAANNLGLIASDMRSLANSTKIRRAQIQTDANIVAGQADQDEATAKRADIIFGFEGMDWASDPRAMDADTWAKIRDSRILPYSFYHALAGIESQGDDAGRERLFGMYKMLKNGTAPDGLSIDMAQQLPKELRKQYEIIDGMLTFNGAQTVSEAVEKTLGLEDIDSAILTLRMQDLDSVLTGDAVSGGWKQERIRPQVARYLRQEIEDRLSVRVSAGDMRQMQGVFTSLVTLGMPPADAVDYLESSAKAAMPETRAIWERGLGAVTRSAFAPSRVFGMPDDPQENLIERIGYWNFARTYTANEFGYDSEEYDRVDRLWYERAADPIIRDQLESALSGTDAATFRDSLGADEKLRAGTHYLLQPSGPDETSPIYQLMGRIGDDWVRIGEVDLKEDYELARKELPPSQFNNDLGTAREIAKEASELLTPDEMQRWKYVNEYKQSSLLYAVGVYDQGSIWQAFKSQNNIGGSSN